VLPKSRRDAPGAQRRVADITRAVALEKPLLGQVQINGPRLGEHDLAGGARVTNFRDSIATRQMHEVSGRAGQFGHRERASDRCGFGERRPARGEMSNVGFAGGEQALGAKSYEVLVLSVNREQCTTLTGNFERAEIIARATLESHHHEDLDTGDTAIDSARNFGDRFGRRIQ